MAYEPTGKVKPFVDAVRREPARIWTPAEAAVLIGCPQSSVGSWLDYSLKQKAVYRGKRAGQVVYSGQPFPPEAAFPHPAERNAAPAPTAAPPADLRVPRFGEPWTPPKMTAPRPGSDVPVPARAPGAPPAACDTGRRSTSAATVSGHELPDDTAAAAASLSVANGGGARVASAGSAHRSAPAQITVQTVERGLEEYSTVREIPSAAAPVQQITPVPPVETAEENDEEAVEPNAFVDIGTGDVILVGCEVDEDGRVTVPSELVRKIVGRMAWSPIR